jgi:TRAP-type uncharacterized transport system substrate-binding protein
MLIIIFYLVNKYFLKEDVQENYLTFFLPYYNNKLNKLYNFYTDNDYNKNFFKRNFDNKELTYSYHYEDEIFTKLLLSFNLSTSNRSILKVIKYKNKMRMLEDLVNEKTNFCTSDHLSVYYYNHILKNNISNLRVLKALYPVFLLTITKKKYNINSLNNIPLNTIIGLKSDGATYYYYEKFFRNLGYKENIDYKIKVYNNENDLYNGFLNSEYQIMLFETPLPNKKLTKFLNENSEKNIIILPFDINNKNLFLKRNLELYIKNDFDLNTISSLYLPVKFGNHEYTKYRPMIKLCYYNRTLLSNTYTNIDIVYSIMSLYNKNYKYLNKSLEVKIYPIKIYNIPSFMDYHRGVIKYLYDIGFLSNIDNPNCQYLVGKKACNAKTIKNNNF